MIIDPATAGEADQYSFTVVGAGFAGLFLAQKLAALGRVLVVEAGTLDEPLALGKGYYEIEASGLPTPSLGTRLSSFGGTSNHWTGQSRPFSPAIFSNRPYLGIAGWPIDYRDFASHLKEAQAWLNLPQSYDVLGPSSLERGVLAAHRGLTADLFFTAHPLPKLGDAATRDLFLAHPAIDFMLGTRVLDIVLDGGRVKEVQISDRVGRRFNMLVQTLLLCTGGVENARLLLWSGRRYARGNPLLGGPNELTGKYYTEHPVYHPVELYIDGRADLSDGLRHQAGGVVNHYMWRPDDAFLERHRLPRFAALLEDEGLFVDGDDAPAPGDGNYLRESSRFKLTLPALKFEQTPHEKSCVTLSSRLDRDGTPIAQVHWELLPQDLENYRRATLLFCGLLSQGGFARARLRPDYRHSDWTNIVPGRSSHHIGTTRMAHSPLAGVVDTNCKMFGLENLYVAGCSIFPHGDYLNPTLNFLALAGRLAAQLTVGLARSKGYRFGRDQTGNSHLVEGWSAAEDLGVWTDGPRARMVLPANGAKRLRFRGHAYRGGADVALTINGREMFRGPALEINRFECEIASQANCEILMDFSSLRSPAELGESEDSRLLGFFLEALELY